MASAVNDNSEPTAITDVLQVSTLVIYATGRYNNAPEGTTITAEWVYIVATPEIFIDDALVATLPFTVE
jgi:hypothetical protein